MVCNALFAGCRGSGAGSRLCVRGEGCCSTAGAAVEEHPSPSWVVFSTEEHVYFLLEGSKEVKIRGGNVWTEWCGEEQSV